MPTANSAGAGIALYGRCQGSEERTLILTAGDIGGGYIEMRIMVEKGDALIKLPFADARRLAFWIAGTVRGGDGA